MSLFKQQLIINNYQTTILPFNKGVRWYATPCNLTDDFWISMEAIKWNEELPVFKPIDEWDEDLELISIDHIFVVYIKVSDNQGRVYGIRKYHVTLGHSGITRSFEILSKILEMVVKSVEPIDGEDYTDEYIYTYNIQHISAVNPKAIIIKPEGVLPVLDMDEVVANSPVYFQNKFEDWDLVEWFDIQDEEDTLNGELFEITSLMRQLREYMVIVLIRDRGIVHRYSKIFTMREDLSEIDMELLADDLKILYKLHNKNSEKILVLLRRRTL